MTQRIVMATAPSRRGQSSTPTLCDPLEAAARVMVLAVLVFGSIHLAIDYIWYEVGWLGSVGLRQFWAMAVIAAAPCVLLFWLTQLPPPMVAAVNGGVLVVFFLVRLALLPAMGFGSFPSSAFPIQVVCPPVYCLAAFGGALLVCWLARLCRADLKRA